MDALRKAEESKRQAEQKKNESADEPKASSDAAASPDEVIEKETIALSQESIDKIEIQIDGELPPDPTEKIEAVVDIEFEEPAVKESEEAVEIKFESEPPHSEIEISSQEQSPLPKNEYTGFELEPRVETKARTPSFSNEQPKVDVTGREESADLPTETEAHVEDALSVSNFLGSGELEEAVSRASAELEKQIPVEIPAPEKPSDLPDEPIDETTKEYRPGSEQQIGGLKRPVTEPQAPAEIPSGSIEEKTADSRKSAKSVFAAKQFANNNRKGLPIPLLGVAAVLLLGFGLYFYVSLNSTSGISFSEATLAGNSLPERGRSLEEFASVEDSEVVGGDQLEIDPVTDSSPRVNAAFSAASNINLTSAAEFTIGEIVNEATEVVSQIGAASELVNVGQSVLTELPNIADLTTNRTPVEEPEGAADPVSPAIQESAIQPGLRPTLGGAVPVTNEVVSDTRELISFRKSSQEKPIPLALTQGFAAYQEGEFKTAEDLYRQTLDDSPENLDALLGLAAIASLNEETGLAMDLYSRVLGLDPSNALAKTAISTLVPLGSLAEQERELRRLLSQNPNVAVLAFAIGNFYAKQSRWADAQQYYFRALQLAKANQNESVAVSPDYAFNLAISLERLNQSKPALNFYQEALELASRTQASFDLNVARARVAGLTRGGEL